MDESRYDVVVIGAGVAGENAADRAVQGGLTVALVEQDLVGGDCSYWACMPTKALLRPGQALRAAQHVAGAAQAIVGGLDADAVLARRDDTIHHRSDASQVEWVAGAGIDLVRGVARLDGPRRVRVAREDGRETALLARAAVVVATGSDPVIPAIDGLRDADPWTSREAAASSRVPASLAVIG
ncbi:MAG: FAD-dependent oxidoreductase, partial [Microbacterium sp.]